MRPLPSRRLATLLAVAALLTTAGLVGAAPAAARTGPVVVNEAVSTGATPDYVELTNTGTSPVDISGYRILDDKDSHDPVVVPAGTTLAAGGFAAFDTEPKFGLGDADTVRLYAPTGTTPVDSYSWTTPAATSYGRCPDGTGAFTTTRSATRGAANDCGPAPLPPVRTDAAVWPGPSTVADADDAGVLGEDQSGVFYEPSGTTAPGVLWTVQNDPGVLWRLLWNGTTWTPDTANGWAQGKQLRYPDGTGEPDSEGVTLVGGSSAAGVFVATERDNANSSVSRPEILRFDVSGSGAELVATAAWDVTADLPAVGPNLGFEALTYVPDAALVAGGFVDAGTGAVDDPAAHGAHFGGLFLAGLEADGTVYAYALDESGTRFTRIGAFSSGFPTVMELQWDGEAGVLRAVCDNTCTGQQTVLRPANGSFAVTAAYDRPAGLPDVNNEGFAIAPDALCVDGVKPAIWADDDGTDGHALRQGGIACTAAAPGGTAPTTGGTTAGQPGAAAPLAATGAVTGAPLGVGLAALVLGVVLLVAGRRRLTA